MYWGILENNLQQTRCSCWSCCNEATLDVLLEQEHHIEEIQRLEAEAARWVKQETENAEWQRALMQTSRATRDKKLKIAKARQQVYDPSECSDEEINKLLHQRVFLKAKVEVKHESNSGQHYSPSQAVTHPKQEDSTAALVRAFAESISASRIPVPEPTTFNGDPLRFNDWKVSFQTLIEKGKTFQLKKIYIICESTLVEPPRRPSRVTSC